MGNIIFALDLYDKFLDIRTENIWTETFGGCDAGLRQAGRRRFLIAMDKENPEEIHE